MRLGPFFFDTKEIFLILLAALVWSVRYFGWEIPLFDAQKLLLLIILFLLAKGLLPAIHNENFLILALFTLILSFYLVELQLVLFFVISLILFRFLKVI